MEALTKKLTIFSLLLAFVFVFVAGGIPFPETVSGFTDLNIFKRGASDAVGPDFIQSVVAGAMVIVLKFTALLTALGGLVLDGAIYFTVVQMSENYSKITAIDTAWRTIRDVANMAFIFILLYAAIKTILGIGSDVKKLIVNVIIVAVLINFSLFFTQVVIDASNVLALTFYDAMVPSASGGVTPTVFGLNAPGLSGAFMEQLKLNSLFEVVQDNQIDFDKIATIGLMGSLMLLITAFVFFSVGIMFIIRYVVLILVLILSPIAFMAYVLPALEEYGKKWKDALIGQAFFAPIYMVLTWITLIVLGDVISSTLNTGSGGVKATLSGIVLGEGGLQGGGIESMALFINFVIIIVFLLASLMIAKTWANKAGGAVAGMNKWAFGKAGKMSFGLAAQTGRLVAGGATMSPDGKRYKKLEARSAEGGIGGARARMRLALSDKMRTSSFDARRSPLGGALASAGLDAGPAGGLGGFAADKKITREFLERPGTEAHKKRQERGRKAKLSLGIVDSLDDVKENDRLVALEAVAAAGGPALSPSDAAKLAELRTGQIVDKFETSINNSTAKEIEAIVESNRKLLASQAFANRISVQQLDAINKSDKFSETEKNTLKANRFSAIRNGMAAMKIPAGSRTPVQQVAADSLGKSTKRLSDIELEMMDSTYLNNSNFVANLRPGQVDVIRKGLWSTASQKDEFLNTRNVPILDALDTARPDYAPNAKIVKETITKQFSHKDVAGLMGKKGTFVDHTGAIVVDTPILTHPEVLEQYSPKMLKRMAEEMSTGDIRTVREAIVGAGGKPRSSSHLKGLVRWLGTEDGNNFS